MIFLLDVVPNPSYKHYMPFVRRKQGQVLIVHSFRRPANGVRQEVLHRFPSPDDLCQVLQEGWKQWKDEVRWRYPSLQWNWKDIRERLNAELEQWQEAPSGADLRRRGRVLRQAEQLKQLLEQFSRVSASDLKTLEEAHPVLKGLEARIHQLLDAPGDIVNFQENHMETQVERPLSASGSGHGSTPPPSPPTTDKVEALFERGMDAWQDGDRRAARRFFRQVLERDPYHSEALNYLGIDWLERRQLKKALKLFESAVDAASRTVVRERGLVEWGWLGNRPYLRALGNLALTHLERSEVESALNIHEQLMTLNPNDNQGIRWLLGEDYHRLNRLEDAIAAYERALEEPGVCHNLALALYQTGREDSVPRAIVRALAANRYIAPMLLGESWTRVPGFHGTNMAEPEWAADYVARAGDLWRRVPGSAELLRGYWNAEPIRRWLEELAEIMVTLKDLAPGDERSSVVRRWHGLTTDGTLRRIADRAAEAVTGRPARPKPPMRPFHLPSV